MIPIVLRHAQVIRPVDDVEKYEGGREKDSCNFVDDFCWWTPLEK